MREFDKNTWDKQTYKGKGILITVLFCFSFFFNSAVIAGGEGLFDSHSYAPQFTPSNPSDLDSILGLQSDRSHQTQYRENYWARQTFDCGELDLDNCVSCDKISVLSKRSKPLVDNDTLGDGIYMNSTRLDSITFDPNSITFDPNDGFNEDFGLSQVATADIGESSYDYDSYESSEGSDTPSETPKIVDSGHDSYTDLYTCVGCQSGYTLTKDPNNVLVSKCITKKEECEGRGDDYYWVEAKKTCHNKTSCSETQGYIWDDEDKTCITKKDSCKKKEGHLWNDEDKTCITKKDRCKKKEGHVWKNNQCITKKKECEGREDHYWVEAKKACYNKDSCSETQGYVWNDVDKTCMTVEAPFQNREEREIYGDTNGSGSILDAANPMDVLNKIRRATAMDDATPLSDAIDAALEAYQTPPVSP